MAGRAGMKWLFRCPSLGEALSNLDVQSGRRQARAVVLSQGLLGVAVAIVCLLGWGVRAGASALLGAGIGVAATSLMAFALLRQQGISGIELVVAAEPIAVFANHMIDNHRSAPLHGEF